MASIDVRSRFILVLVAAVISGCNMPVNPPRRTPAFTAEDLRLTAEAIVQSTRSVIPEASGPAETGPPAGSIWPTLIPTSEGLHYEYRVQPGDTLAGITGRFGVNAGEVSFSTPLPTVGYLPQGEVLLIPVRLGDVSSAQRLIPDRELVFSSQGEGFNLDVYITEAGGYLSQHKEQIEEEEATGSQIVQRVAAELSVNPRLLLALLEYRSGWVYRHPPGAERDAFPLGFRIPDRRGLYEELKITATQLNLAYYGWRAGTFTELRFEAGSSLRLDPTLNAASVAVMHLFSLLSNYEAWQEDVYSPYGFAVHYYNLFGDPWTRADNLAPLIPAAALQPTLELPFLPFQAWSLTAGPHYAWNTGTPLGALDLSPIVAEEPCSASSAWVTASAAGVIVRARHNAVALDLDSDGDEGTGWVVVYYHIANQEMIAEGTVIAIDQRIGHPSCEGGSASGTHVHVARKYNGEWLAADGPLPFVMSGWQAVAGGRIYQGQMVKAGQVVTADSAGRSGSTISR